MAALPEPAAGAARRLVAPLRRLGPSALLGLCLAGLAGCAGTPAAPPDAPRADPPPPSVSGRVLGRSERFLIYQPGPGDTLRSLAARWLGSDRRDWVIADFNGVAQAEPDRPLAIPLQPIDPVGVYADHYQTVPILCYHRFAPGTGNAGGKMVISAASFAAQLDWLARNDYRVIPLAQLTEFLQGRQALPRRAVVITIDDGYESVWRVALPLLRQHGFPATLFVYTDFIGAGDALGWSQLQEMAAGGLVDVQSHSKTHRNLNERPVGDTEVRYQQLLDAETRLPRELLERRLATPVNAYAFPYGDANQAVLDLLARQRVQLGLTVNPGGNPFFAQPLMLRRTMIYGDLDLAAFRLKLQTARPMGAP